MLTEGPVMVSVVNRGFSRPSDSRAHPTRAAHLLTLPTQCWSLYHGPISPRKWAFGPFSLKRESTSRVAFGFVRDEDK